MRLKKTAALKILIKYIFFSPDFEIAIKMQMK